MSGGDSGGEPVASAPARRRVAGAEPGREPRVETHPVDIAPGCVQTGTSAVTRLTSDVKKRDLGREILDGLDEIAAWREGALKLKTRKAAHGRAQEQESDVPGTKPSQTDRRRRL